MKKKTMFNYTLYCTEWQIKKVLKLGVSIHKYPSIDGDDIKGVSDIFPYTKAEFVIPTAEQMLGFLRSKGFRFRIKNRKESSHWEVTMGDWIADGELSTPEDATLAAIDAALDFLIKNKK